MEQEENYRVKAYIASSGYELVDKWFSYYDEAEEYYNEHIEIFKSDHQGRNIILQIVDGTSTYKNMEFNEPEEEMEEGENW